MLLNSEWSEGFVQKCLRVKSARKRSVASGRVIYSSPPEGTCCVVAGGYLQILDPRVDGTRSIRLVSGKGGLFGDRPFGRKAFRGFISPQPELAIAHGPGEIIEIERGELEAATRGDADFASMLLESLTSRAEFLERRLLWQFTNPIRARVAATLRDLICYEGQRCTHGHTIDIRLSHQDLSELVGAARPVVSAELVRMKREGLLEYTRCYFCVDDLAGLDRVATA